MTSDPSLTRRVARLENDTQSIYELITEIWTTQDEHTRRLDGIDTRLEAVDSRLDGIDTHLQEIGSTLVEVVRRLPEP